MSWQERVKKYQAEAARRESEAREVKRQHILERLPPLFAVLEKFDCERLLLQMRDEVWELGEVSTLPKLDEVTAETPIEARACLIAEWPFYKKGGYTWPGWDSDVSQPSKIGIWHCELSIVAKHRGELAEKSGDAWFIIGTCFGGEKKLYHSFGKSCFVKVSEPNARVLLEEQLVKDILERERQVSSWVPPYDRLKKLAEPRVIQAIIEEGLKPPKGFEYLLELAGAEKARRGSK